MGMKNKIYLSFATLLTLFSFATRVAAQVNIDVPDGKTKIEIDYFKPSAFTDLMKFGALGFVGYIAIFLVGFMFIYITVQIAISAGKIIQSQGDSGKLEEGVSEIQKFMRGVLIAMLFLLAFVAVGIFMGSGNIMKWPSKLGQCGGGGVLFNAEYDASLKNEKIYEKETQVLCCRNFESLDFGDENTVLVSPVGGIRGFSKDGPSAGNPFAIVVGTETDGGWMFILPSATGESRDLQSTQSDQEKYVCSIY